MTTLLYRDRRLLFLVLGVVLAFAATAATQIPRQEDPTITGLFATIVTPFPGAAPARVESQVTERIEEELRTISEIDTITSVSRTGISVVTIELSQYIGDERIDQVWGEVRDKLSDAARTFPQGAFEPNLDTDRTGAYTFIAALTPEPGRDVSDSLMRRIAEGLQDRLREVPETRHVRLFGERVEEVRVTLDPDRLAALGLSFDQISTAVSEADAKFRAGVLQDGSRDLLVEIAGEFERVARIREIPVATDQNGATLRLGDLGSVERTVQTPAEELAYSNGVRAILIAARMEDDRRVDIWAAETRAVFDAYRDAMPIGLSLDVTFDQNDYTQARYEELGRNLAIGVGLVVTVLFLTLGWRAAAIVASLIPIAALMSLTAMNWFGLPIHQMSVTGLIVALGLLVDSAIVTVDEIRRRLADGRSRLQAVDGAVRRLVVPLTASTITTILAFLPMALLPGPPGDFVGAIAMSVIIMLTASLLLAVTVAPALAGLVLKGTLVDREARGPGRFTKFLAFTLRHKALTIIGALVLPLMGFASFPTLTSQFFPGVDRNQLYVQVDLPDGTAIERTDDVTRRIDEVIRGYSDVLSVQWVIGRNAPAFYYNMKSDRDGDPTFSEALVTTADEQATEILIAGLQHLLNDRFPEAQILVRGLVQGPPVDAPVELRLVGPDLHTLQALGEDIREILASLSGVQHTRANLIGASPKLTFELDEAAVRLAGLTLGEVARQLDAALSGAVRGSVLEETEELPVRVRLDGTDRADTESLLGLMIVPRSPSRFPATFPAIPISALGDLALKPSDTSITRRNGERINTVQAFIERDRLPEEVLQQALSRLEARGFGLPPGYRLEIGGDADSRAETSQNLAKSAGLVVILTVVTIFLTFRSYRLSLLTGLVAFLSMGLSLLALAVFQYPFGIQALIGTIGSIGVSVNAAIIVLTGLQQNERAMTGDRTAIAETVSRSARHIISTTLTTVCGFIPLILEGGGFWPPFAMAIAGGVGLSVVLAFFLTPQMFAIAMRPRLGAAGRAVPA